MNSPYVKVYCSGRVRHVPVAVWDALQGPKPANPEYFLNNGCTLAPDSVGGKPTWPACVLHDYHYNYTQLDRKEADSLFRKNLQVCLEAYGTFVPVAWLIALFYWRAVRRAGRRFYHSTGDAS